MQRSSYRLPGIQVTEHEYEVPLDYANPDGDTITVFAREVTTSDGGDKPWLLYLQGGPGFPAPRPTGRDGWLGRALDEYRVLLLDQRGTGRSSPVTYQTMAAVGDADAQAQYLMHFRADSIVADAEHLRHELVGEGRGWTVLGQSYGGFCLLHYMSEAPHGLEGALFTGGLPPLEAHCDEVYRRTYRHVATRNRGYYERYPDDAEQIRDICAVLDRSDQRLPTGERLTVPRFQQLGCQLGFSRGHEAIHYLVEDAFVDRDRESLSYGFLKGFQSALAFDTNPIYSLLHEACYAQGFATSWSAERIRKDFPEFAFQTEAAAPVFLTGEMIYPWMFDELPQLQPLQEAAEILAAWDGWPTLYDAERLAANEVPAAAVIYGDDMYVDRELSEHTASVVRGLGVWLTNEYEHNGLRTAGRKVFGRLSDMLHGRLE